MDTLQKKVICCLEILLISALKIFWRRIPPDLPTYVIILRGPKCFSRTGAHTRSAATAPLC